MLDLESLTLDDVGTVIEQAWGRFGGIRDAANELGVSEYAIRNWLCERPRSFPTEHLWRKMIEAAGADIADRVVFGLGESGVGVQSLVLFTYASDADLRALTDKKWSAQIQAAVVSEAADALMARKIKVAIGMLDAVGYRAWCNENEIAENESPATRTTYVLSKRDAPERLH